MSPWCYLLRIGRKKGCQKAWMQAGKISSRSDLVGHLHQTQGSQMGFTWEDTFIRGRCSISKCE